MSKVGDRTSRFARPSLVVLVLIASCVLLLARLAATEDKQKALPKSAQDKIRNALTQSPEGSVIVFNRDGETKNSATVPKSTTEQFTLREFLDSSPASPAKDCKDPVPTPPPPCILCSSGQVVCTNAKFREAPGPPRRGAADTTGNKPTGNRPEEDKPQ